MILAGVLLKMGTYGLLRFAFPLFPEAARVFAPYLAILAVIGIVYGALVAMVQPDMHCCDHTGLLSHDADPAPGRPAAERVRQPGRR